MIAGVKLCDIFLARQVDVEQGGRERGGGRGEVASTCRIGTSEGLARQVVVVLLCTGNERCVNCRQNV